MTSAPLDRALTEPGNPPLRPLPERVVALLRQLDAPPRLAAHLRAVHEVACQVVAWVRLRHPGVAFDAEAVRFGAAVHDIGKVVHPGELSGPGSEHEQEGYELLLAHGIPADLARFARTHAAWTAGTAIEDLLVSVADKVWKAKRVTDLEQLLADRLAAASGQEPWEVFLGLDDELGRIAAGADDRLAFQAEHPV